MIRTRLTAVLCCMTLLLPSAALSAAAAAGAPTRAQTVTVRVEGTHRTVCDGTVALQNGDTAYTVLVRALKATGLTEIPASAADTAPAAGSFHITADPTYGHYIQRIGTDSAWSDSTGYCWWSFYVNGVSAPLGADGITPRAGDALLFGYCDGNGSLPQVTLGKQRAVCGESVSATVTAEQVAYLPPDYNPSVTTVPVADTEVTLGGKTFTTGADGKVMLTMPASAGTYDLVVKEGDDAAGDPEFIRSITPVRVYASLPAGDDGSGYSFVTDDSIDVEAAGPVSARLDVTAGASGKTAALAGAKTAVVRNCNMDYELDLAAGTAVSGPADWDGTLALPQAADASSVKAANVTVKAAVAAGGAGLALSKPARLTLPGQTGLSAAWVENGTFHRITNVLSADEAPDGAGADYTAVYDNGTDLVIYTTRLGTFVSYLDGSASGISETALAAARDACAASLSTDSSRWAAFALARAGKTASDGWLTALKQEVTENKGNFDSVTDLSAAILTLAANGYSVTDFCGVNLADRLADFSDVTSAGLNGPDFALLALDATDAARPSDPKWTDEKLLGAILTAQHADGSFALTADAAGDPDMTAITLLALAPHRTDAKVSAAVEKALGWLSANQQADGGFKTSYGAGPETSESVSTVLMAVCSLGIDPKTDPRFVKDGSETEPGKTLLDALMAYRTAKGGFEHLSGTGADTTAGEQALMALTAYARFESGANPLYGCTDVKPDKTVTDGQASTSAPVSSGAMGNGASASSGPVSGRSGSGSTGNPDTGSAAPVAAVCALAIAALVLPAAKAARSRKWK